MAICPAKRHPAPLFVHDSWADKMNIRPIAPHVCYLCKCVIPEDFVLESQSAMPAIPYGLARKGRELNQPDDPNGSRCSRVVAKTRLVPELDVRADFPPRFEGDVPFNRTLNCSIFCQAINTVPSRAVIQSRHSDILAQQTTIGYRRHSPHL